MEMAIVRWRRSMLADEDIVYDCSHPLRLALAQGGHARQSMVHGPFRIAAVR